MGLVLGLGRERREEGCCRRQYRQALSDWCLYRRLWREVSCCLCIVDLLAMNWNRQGMGVWQDEPFRDKSGIGDASRLKFEDESPLLG